MCSYSSFTQGVARYLFVAIFVLAPLMMAHAGEISQEHLDESLIAAAGRGDMTTFNIAVGLGANLNATDRRGNNVVLAATQGNRTQLLRTLLDKGIYPNALGSSGFTPLTFAAKEGSTPNVGLLLKAGADPNQRDALGETPLHLATQFGHQKIIAQLAAAGARIDATNAAGEPPLITAIHYNQANAFDGLLSLGADPNVSDKNHQSALFLALLEEREQMALLLVEKGAQFDRRPRQYTPLQMARFMGYASVVGALERRGARE